MPRAVTLADYRSLAEIRYCIRAFLNFSENMARSVDLEPQQHQLLLTIHALPADVEPTIKRVAERLFVRHHSAVELVNRSVERGLVSKRAARDDRRVMHLSITRKGRSVLERLSRAHRTELRSMAPSLRNALSDLVGEQVRS
jgi:DNA-binding MarR family transcriptional regulator